ncbi:HdeD family acid-resistance protein [uncultured Dubosiella sp.]|uniref:HdeD family acid-resistance protein n=1 Tax=uncultured Dubosiella sp. TaxID=1937011 RepID=UPI0025EF0809|nr:DUF308 domain-containing protein [uncultured Dubosiella sp.]
MNNFIKQTNSQQRLFAIIYIVFGIILCFFNKGILIMAARVLGVILLAYGILELYIYFVRRQNVTAIPLYTGLPCTLAGLFMIFSPQSLIAIIPVLAGVILIVNSIMQMQRSFILKDHGFDNWLWTFVISVVTMVAGIVVLLQPIQTLAFILQVVGVFLIVEGIIMLFNEHEIKKYMK